MYSSLRRDLQPRGASARTPVGPPFLLHSPPVELGDSSPQSRAESPLTQESSPSPQENGDCTHPLYDRVARLPVEGSTAPSPQRMRGRPSASSPPPSLPPSTHALSPAKLPGASGQAARKGEERLLVPPGGWGSGQGQKRGLYGGGSAPACEARGSRVSLRVVAMFPFQGKRKKQLFPWS